MATQKTIAPLSVFDQLSAEETPEEVLRRLQQERVGRVSGNLREATGKSRNAQIAAALGSALGYFAAKKYSPDEKSSEYKRAESNEAVQEAFTSGQTANEQEQLAQAQQLIAQEAPADIQKAMAEGGAASLGLKADSHTASQAGYTAAIDRAIQLGRPDLARTILAERDAADMQYKQQQLELNKLKAQTREANAKADEIVGGGKPAEYEQLTREVESLEALKERSPGASAEIDQAIARRKERMEYLTTRVGRTEYDTNKGLTDKDIYEDTMKVTRARDNLNRTVAMFKPEFLNVESRIKGVALKWADMASGVIPGLELPDAEKKWLGEYSAFRSEAIEGVNQYIRDMTGAQLSVYEQDRLRKAVADVERASPSEFQAVLERTVRLANAAALKQAEVIAADPRSRLELVARPMDEWLGRVPSPFSGQRVEPTAKRAEDMTDEELEAALTERGL